MQMDLEDQIWSYQPKEKKRTEYSLLPGEFRKILGLFDIPPGIIRSIIEASEIKNREKYCISSVQNKEW